MEPISVLTIDNESISINQFFNYLRYAGGLQRAVGEVLRQYILEKELQERKDINIDDKQVDFAIMNFMQQSQLIDPNRFNEWLKTNNITYEFFRSQIVLGLKIDSLKNKVITKPDLEAYFTKQKELLQKVVLSRIILANKDKAESLKAEIVADQSKFNALAKEHSLTEDKVANGMMGPLRIGSLPTILKNNLAAAKEGDLIGPIEIENRYCLFRVDGFVNPTLDEPLQQELHNQLFEQWFRNKLSQKQIKLEV